MVFAARCRYTLSEMTGCTPRPAPTRRAPRPALTRRTPRRPLLALVALLLLPGCHLLLPFGGQGAGDGGGGDGPRKDRAGTPDRVMPTEAAAAQEQGAQDGAGACPPVCSRCVGDVCFIERSLITPTACPKGFKCRVSCHAASGWNCKATLTCGQAVDCIVDCVGAGSCAAQIDCGSTQSCQINCSGDTCGVLRADATAAYMSVYCTGGACRGVIDCRAKHCQIQCVSGSCTQPITCQDSDCQVDCQSGACAGKVTCEGGGCRIGCQPPNSGTCAGGVDCSKAKSGALGGCCLRCEGASNCQAGTACPQGCAASLPSLPCDCYLGAGGC